MRYVLYARKSSESEDRQVLSIDSQIETLKSLAAGRRLRIVKTFKESQSAKQPGRPMFEEMLQMITDKKADGIICWKLDRLARNPICAGKVQWALQQGKIKSIITAERDYLPEDNALLMSVELGMATQYVIDLRKNVMRGMTTKASRGWTPGRPPIGYMNDPHNKEIVQDPYNFPLVRQLFEMAMTGNYDLMQLLRIANNQLHLKLRVKGQLIDRKVSKNMIYKMMRNPFYAGQFKWNSQVYEGKHPLMLTALESKRLREVFEASNRLEHRKSRNKYKLSTLIRCPCGYQVGPWRCKNRPDGRIYIYYTCTGRFQKEEYRNGCRQPLLREEQLSEQVVEALKSVTLHPKFVAWVKKNASLAKKSTVSEHRARIASLEKRRGQLEARRKTLVDLMLDKRINTNDYNDKNEQIEEQINLALDEIKRLELGIAQLDEVTDKTLTMGQQMLKVYDSNDFNEAKSMLRYVFEEMWLEDRQLRVKVRRPFVLLRELQDEQGVKPLPMDIFEIVRNLALAI